jgi:L-lysine exporter family protein LysE/ArgO
VPPTLIVAAAGFGMGMSLIVAIGAQNAFVLRQGIRREAVGLVVLICAGSDAALIAAGVGGMGAAVQARPAALSVVGILGGAFLLGYAVLAARRMLRPGALQVDAATPAAGAVPAGPLAATAPGRRRGAITCLALTWLNPHVYLDTVLLLGSVAAGYGSTRWAFGLGAAVASVCWFTGLGFGARLLSGFFARPSAWRLLDGLVAATMAVLGLTLLVRTWL